MDKQKGLKQKSSKTPLMTFNKSNWPSSSLAKAHLRYKLRHQSNLISFVRKLYVNRVKFLIKSKRFKPSSEYLSNFKIFASQPINPRLFKNSIGRQAINFYLVLRKSKIYQNAEWRATSRLWRRPMVHTESFIDNMKAYFENSKFSDRFKKLARRIHHNLKTTKTLACIHTWDDEKHPNKVSATTNKSSWMIPKKESK